jgi:hypothetical protein
MVRQRPYADDGADDNSAGFVQCSRDLSRYNEDSNTIRGEALMPMYPEIIVIPMREELTRLGIEELLTVEEVDRALTAS